MEPQDEAVAASVLERKRSDSGETIVSGLISEAIADFVEEGIYQVIDCDCEEDLHQAAAVALVEGAFDDAYARLKNRYKAPSDMATLPQEKDSTNCLQAALKAAIDAVEAAAEASSTRRPADAVEAAVKEAAAEDNQKLHICELTVEDAVKTMPFAEEETKDDTMPTIHNIVHCVSQQLDDALKVLLQSFDAMGTESENDWPLIAAEELAPCVPRPFKRQQCLQAQAQPFVPAEPFPVDCLPPSKPLAASTKPVWPILVDDDGIPVQPPACSYMMPSTVWALDILAEQATATKESTPGPSRSLHSSRSQRTVFGAVVRSSKPPAKIPEPIANVSSGSAAAIAGRPVGSPANLARSRSTTSLEYKSAMALDLEEDASTSSSRQKPVVNRDMLDVGLTPFLPSKMSKSRSLTMLHGQKHEKLQMPGLLPAINAKQISPGTISWSMQMNKSELSFERSRIPIF
eukprot:gnl/TRDRNA2_/TRDRNA2_35376_c0_seq1.p1 gnl/TRDRNA2_/TRDRNA2_35376_c0~~gnl/TRDRNA2_/TRDRNA2_35376_c0_seq1.p1  ORF type:complete len:493 (-),score=97.95 gnl/TRDRNA2_/TRDRNA2_35376_c0_seq1:312-1691(-)